MSLVNLNRNLVLEHCVMKEKNTKLFKYDLLYNLRLFQKTDSHKTLSVLDDFP